MPAGEPAPEREIPFRLIAIAGDEPAVEHLVALARALPETTFGLMLRDPGHRPVRVAALARHMFSGEPPGNLVPIANAHPVPGIGWLHLTAAQLSEVSRGAPPPGPGIRFGVSAHSLEEALEAERAGAEYMTFSPLFPTSSKPGHPGAGLDALRRVCGAVGVPVFALGGIDARSARLCLDAGAHGIASISLFMAPDAVESLLSMIGPA